MPTGRRKRSFDHLQARLVTRIEADLKIFGLRMVVPL